MSTKKRDQSKRIIFGESCFQSFGTYDLEGERKTIGELLKKLEWNKDQMTKAVNEALDEYKKAID